MDEYRGLAQAVLEYEDRKQQERVIQTQEWIQNKWLSGFYTSGVLFEVSDFLLLCGRYQWPYDAKQYEENDIRPKIAFETRAKVNEWRDLHVPDDYDYVNEIRMEVGRMDIEEATAAFCDLICKCPAQLINRKLTRELTITSVPFWVTKCEDDLILLNAARNLSANLLGLACTYGVNLDTIYHYSKKDLRVMLDSYLPGVTLRRAGCTGEHVSSTIPPIQQAVSALHSEPEMESEPVAPLNGNKRSRVALGCMMLEGAGVSVKANKAAAARILYYLVNGTNPENIANTTELRIVKELYGENKRSANIQALSEVRPLIERAESPDKLLDKIDGYISRH